MYERYTRRDWLLQTASAVSGACLAGSPVARAAAPAATVSIARCKTYEASELVPALDGMFDRLGGLARIVKGKTVAVKINLTGSPAYRVGHLPLGETHYTNPHLIGAALHLMARAGARRIRVLESPWSSAAAVEETMLQANWNPQDILGAAPRVEFENTNYLGQGKKYHRFVVPNGGLMYPAYDLNHSYADCDVFVSLTKMKEHQTTGITLSMKNCFGITPCSIYGVGAGVDEPNERPTGGRTLIHNGFRQPSKSAPPEIPSTLPKEGGYRVPRAVVDLVTVRPVDLAIVDAVKTTAGGEGPWAPSNPAPVHPGVIVAGTNPVNTDAVCMGIMGFDPMADRGAHPFEKSDNMLRLAEDAGLGTRDLKRIEVAGAQIHQVMFDFAGFNKARASVRSADTARGL